VARESRPLEKGDKVDTDTGGFTNSEVRPPNNIQTDSNTIAIKMGDRPLKKLEESGVITRSGGDWVRAALDPFHDYEIPDLKGMPDLDSEPSVIVRTQQSATLSAPIDPATGLPTLEPWDANIFMSPIDLSTTTSISDYYTSFGQYTPNGNSTSMPGTFTVKQASPVRLDGLVMMRNEGGKQMMSPSTVFSGLHLDDYLIPGEESDLLTYRVIGMGFEVVNTTATLYQQGAVTVYELGNGENLSTLNVEEGASTPPRIGDSRSFRSPPATLAEAKQSPGAHTWAAKEGNYNVAKFSGLDSYTGLNKRDFVFAQNGASAASLDTPASWVTHKAGRALDPSVLEQSGCASHISPINTNGAYYTGLSPQTTLQVTWRVVLERLPGPFDLTMLALAQPSAQFDPRALELYSHIIREMAPGVPVSYNDAGKYFRMAEKVVREVSHRVAPVLRTAVKIGVPGAAEVSAAARDAAAAAKLIKSAARKGGGGVKAARRAAVPAMGAPGRRK